MRRVPAMSVCLLVPLLVALSPSVVLAAESELAGDVNCDGGVDLADAVYILNWLFLGGPALCPIPNGAELRAQIAELEGALDAKTAQAQACNDSLLASQAEAIAALQDLLGCRLSLSQTEAALQAKTADLTACEGALQAATAEREALAADLQATQGALAATEDARDLCQATLAQVNPDLAACVSGLGAAEAALATCTGDLSATTQQLTDTQAALTAAEARIADLEIQNAALTADNVALNAELARRGQVPVTGQTGCYDNSAEIPCDTADFPGQDGFYQRGCPNEGRFVDNGDGTVTDNCTGLMWQKDTGDVSGDGSIGGEDQINWQGALQYCDGLSFAGRDDWRLPNIFELQTIVDYGRYNPAIDPAFLGDGYAYWSSTTFEGDVYTNAWFSDLARGHNANNGKTVRLFVRAVRTIQPGE